MGCHVLLQGIFPTQGLNLCLLTSPAWQLHSKFGCYKTEFAVTKSEWQSSITFIGLRESWFKLSGPFKALTGS